MDLSTEIAFGIIKAIAIIAAFVIGAGLLVLIIGSVPLILENLIQGLLDLSKWILKRWGWISSFLLVLTLSATLSGTQYEIIGSIAYLGFFLVAIGYYTYRKNEGKTKENELLEEWIEQSKASVETNSSTDGDETFAEFLKRHRFSILLFTIFIIIINLFLTTFF